MPDVKPQLYADILKCSAERPGALFDAARFTARYVRAVGHDVSPGQCVLLSTSKSVRKAMKLWDISGHMVAFGKFSWTSGILVVILILLGGLGLGLFLKGLGRPRLVLLLLVPCLLGFRSSLAWLEVCIFLLVFMLLRLPMSPPLLFVPSGLLLCGGVVH